MGRGSVVNLYVGVPYCIKTEPSKCGYCLFPVEDFVGNNALEDYFFNYVKKEAAMYKDAMEGQTPHPELDLWPEGTQEAGDSEDRSEGFL